MAVSGLALRTVVLAIVLAAATLHVLLGFVSVSDSTTTTTARGGGGAGGVGGAAETLHRRQEPPLSVKRPAAAAADDAADPDEKGDLDAAMMDALDEGPLIAAAGLEAERRAAAVAQELERTTRHRRHSEIALRTSLQSLPLAHALSAVMLAQGGQYGWLAKPGTTADLPTLGPDDAEHVHVVPGLPWDLATVYAAPGAAVPLQLHAAPPAPTGASGGGGGRGPAAVTNPNVLYLVDAAAPYHKLPRPPGRSAFALDTQPWLRVVPTLHAADADVECTTSGDYGIFLAGLDVSPNLYDHFLHHLKTILVVVHRVWGLDALTTADVVLLDAHRSHHMDAYHFESVFREFRPQVLPFAEAAATSRAPTQCRCYRHALVIKPHARWNGELDAASADALEGAFVLGWLRHHTLSHFGLLANDASPSPLAPVRVLYVTRGILSRLPHGDLVTGPNDTALFDADAEPVPVRIILNEPELIAQLRQELRPRREVELVVRSLDGLSPQDQVELVQSADVLVGPHGAAMTHMLWMRPSTVVLELLPYGFADSGYRNLAHETGKVYLHWQNTDRARSRARAQDIRSGKVHHLCQSNSNFADIPAVVGLVHAALTIASQSGRRSWLPCPDGDTAALKRQPRLAPVDCPSLWVGDTCIEAPLSRIANEVEPPLRLRGQPDEDDAKGQVGGPAAKTRTRDL